jgi:hypothetical protein
MGAQLIEKALAEWRDGERLLRDLPRVDPDHETVRRIVIDLRETYRRLSQASAESREVIAECELTVQGAHEKIAHVRSRLDPEP